MGKSNLSIGILEKEEKLNKHRISIRHENHTFDKEFQNLLLLFCFDSQTLVSDRHEGVGNRLWRLTRIRPSALLQGGDRARHVLALHLTD